MHSTLVCANQSSNLCTDYCDELFNYEHSWHWKSDQLHLKLDTIHFVKTEIPAWIGPDQGYNKPTMSRDLQFVRKPWKSYIYKIKKFSILILAMLRQFEVAEKFLDFG